MTTVDLSSELAAERDRIRAALIPALLAAVRCIPDGEIRSGCVVNDGATVRQRLKAAYWEAIGEELPAVEVSVEWAAWCHRDDPAAIRYDKDQFVSRNEAEVWARAQLGDWGGVNRYSLLRREHHRFEGGPFAEASTPWQVVYVSEVIA